MIFSYFSTDLFTIHKYKAMPKFSLAGHEGIIKGMGSGAGAQGLGSHFGQLTSSQAASTASSAAAFRSPARSTTSFASSKVGSSVAKLESEKTKATWNAETNQPKHNLHLDKEHLFRRG